MVGAAESWGTGRYGKRNARSVAGLTGNRQLPSHGTLVGDSLGEDDAFFVVDLLREDAAAAARLASASRSSRDMPVRCGWDRFSMIRVRVGVWSVSRKVINASAVVKRVGAYPGWWPWSFRTRRVSATRWPTHSGRAADADERRGGRTGPVAVSEQVQPRLAEGARAVGGDVAARAAQVQRGEVGQGRAEAGAPDHRVRVALAAVSPPDPGCRQMREHRLRGLEFGGAGGADGRHGHDVAEGDDPACVRAARVQGAAAGAGLPTSPRHDRLGRGRWRSVRRSSRRRPRRHAARRSRPGSGSSPCAVASR